MPATATPRRRRKSSSGAAAVAAAAAAEAATASASSSSLEPNTADGEVWYLAYGSNMSPKVLTGRRKVVPSSSLPCAVPGYTLGFHYKGIPYLEPGFATIANLTPEMQAAHDQQQEQKAAQQQGAQGGPKGEAGPPTTGGGLVGVGAAAGAAARQQQQLQARQAVAQKGSQSPVMQAATFLVSFTSAVFSMVTSSNEPQSRASEGPYTGPYGQPLHGVVHLVRREEWEAVQRDEGVGDPKSGYQVIKVKCCLYDGEWVMAETLMAAPSSLGNPHAILPSQRYIKILQDGACHHNVDPAYCALLDAQPGYDRTAPGKRAASWLMMAILLSCTVWLVPLLVGLAIVTRYTGLLSIFLPSEQQPAPIRGPKPRHARTERVRKQISHPVSVRVIRTLSLLTHTLHDHVLERLCGSGFR